MLHSPKCKEVDAVRSVKIRVTKIWSSLLCILTLSLLLSACGQQSLVSDFQLKKDLLGQPFKFDRKATVNKSEQGTQIIIKKIGSVDEIYNFRVVDRKSDIEGKSLRGKFDIVTVEFSINLDRIQHYIEYGGQRTQPDVANMPSNIRGRVKCTLHYAGYDQGWRFENMNMMGDDYWQKLVQI